MWPVKVLDTMQAGDVVVNGENGYDQIKRGQHLATLRRRRRVSTAISGEV